ncbi:protein IQ-DOMAIN 32-like isoform X2 [Hibiscus syriacus]|uniref:protein IQ-DOMAIN 32-like isoform X2 n=1 Tax=Hibiscus syriacus TaxID=106335 RepID=UPI00192113D5|nr:protein IQ-DOMAIN 32-like isoform X2 [Hibiscus syriacus]
MGKSTSCFKIITCGGDSAETDDVIHVPQAESKRPNDKKGWSFRKRYDHHQVLSNTVIQEATSGLEQSSEFAGFNFQHPDASIAPEKTSSIQYSEEKPQVKTPEEYIEEGSMCVGPKECTEEKFQLLTPMAYNEEKSQFLIPMAYTEEKSQLLTQEEPKMPESVPITINEAEDDANLDESVVIIIQTAIRGFLAHKEIGKLKNLVKLQAAVRRHLVRRHAAGTLRCLQAIVKMQVLVRARLSQEGLYAENRLDGKLHNDNQNLGSSAIKQNATYTSIEKLLSSKFARQLMDSTPKNKPIHFKCDPLKPNSAWSWLERWMSVPSPKYSSTVKLTMEQPEWEKSNNYETPVTATVPSEEISESNEPKTDVRETLVSSESEENLITDNAANFKFEECERTSSPVMDDMDQPRSDTITSDLNENSQEINSQDQMMQTDAHSQTVGSCLSNKLEIESEQSKHSTKRFASEQLEAEPMKFAFGSRKVSSPSFIAAQTKFKELSSTDNSSRSVDSSHLDVEDESNLDTLSSEADTISRSTKRSITENAVKNRGVQCSDSECGAEISITSTLGSPDISEVGTIGYEYGAKVSEQENFSSNSIKDLNVKENNTGSIRMTDSSLSFADQPDSSPSIADQPKKLDDASGALANLVVADSPQVAQEPPKGTPDLHRDLDSEMGNQAYILSPEASPKCHMIVPESQRTPSSEVSVTARKKKDKSCQKRKSLSAAKSSPLTPDCDSGARSSMELLPKYKKNGKIRNSQGSGRPDNIDGEPRDSNSSNSLPHFMHATESARAKVNAKTSPRSSPDVHDRDIYIKKRHSLPAANGRQGSPRIQRPISQSHQGAKGNGTNPMHEKWQR